ncbi:hypothetical protein DAEQUDRAFT_678419 [Daedalea quercina L-15889]|uniref:Uncharacterized protein n=1 Tax=Daedalea quercina L-15889 TaxID=1314783 RepID=A0A165LL56_9APHY|nr:hypothetical protein DAEQUDRAFT_678419 [Daedalea quercina L-15889]
MANTVTSKPEPYWFLHKQLEQEGIIVESIVPSQKTPNLYFQFVCPRLGAYVISLYYDGCKKAILETHLGRDDLLAMLERNEHVLNLDYVQFNIPRIYGFLDKLFA